MSGPGTATRMWVFDPPMGTTTLSKLVVGGPPDPRPVPFPAYLIEHPKGLVLFDTGLDPHVATDPEALYGPLADLIQLQFTVDQRLDRQIEAAGYRVRDVTHVVMSHLHFDHAGGIKLFPDATFYVGEAELRYAYWPDPVSAPYYRREDFDPLRGRRVVEVTGMDHDLFGDGSVTLLRTPGHSPGGLSLLVRLPGRNFILTGDVVHCREGLERFVHMPIDVDGAEAVRSMRRLRLIEASADALIWVGHDIDDWTSLGAPGCFE